MYPQSEILFPYRSIARLKNLRGEVWRELVKRVVAQPDGELDTIAFSLMMIRLCDCLNCDPGNYKAFLGCDTCSQRTIAGLKLSDQQLVKRFEKARQDVEQYLRNGRLDTVPGEEVVTVRLQGDDRMDESEALMHVVELG
ncbi:MAG TPA: hypothetical protein EYP04_01370 [Anaerolineae bacterium]|nr:hypothetical protein [Anaerolineae bacterium]HIQ06145.1 hypothetical protein [Anaerolineae bacterium]